MLFLMIVVSFQVCLDTVPLFYKCELAQGTNANLLIAKVKSKGSPESIGFILLALGDKK